MPIEQYAYSNFETSNMPKHISYLIFALNKQRQATAG